jgi:hypothetical protein
MSWFAPCTSYPESYSVGRLDIQLSGIWGLSYPIKGVMFYTLQWRDPDDPLVNGPQCPTERSRNHECIVIRDALGDYYYHYEFSQGGGEFVAKFRAPRGVGVEHFGKNYFKGGVRGVDMDEVPQAKSAKRFYILEAKQMQLGKRWARVQAESRCACELRR